MEWISQVEKSGYTVYTNTAGEEYLVINGLDPNQIHTPGLIESFLLQYYGLFAVAYWVLIILTFSYLIFTFIYKPLRARHAAGLPLLSNE